MKRLLHDASPVPSPLPKQITRIQTPLTIVENKIAEENPLRGYDSSPLPPQVPTIVAIPSSDERLDSEAGSLDTTSVASSTARENLNVPYPCLCGARFSSNGRRIWRSISCGVGCRR